MLKGMLLLVCVGFAYSIKVGPNILKFKFNFCSDFVFFL